MSTNSAINPLAYQLEDYGFSWASKDDLDLDLYSRQFFVLGAQTQKALASFNVLIIGATGVAVEVAKNVVLAGPKSVTVADNSPTQWTDLASQFYLSEEDVGKPRAACCVPKLAELNPHTEVHAYDGELTQEFLTGFQCVVVCDSNDEEALIQYNGWCHEANVPFIATTSRGLAGYVFSDFGKEFTVIDKTGEDELSGYILDISPEGLVSCTDDEPHGLSDEDSLTFSEVQGLSSLNGCEPVKIRVETPFSFTIQNFAAEGKYEGGGLWKQVKVPEVIEFNTLADELVKPTEFMLTDFGKFGRAEQLHVLFRGLDAYQKANDGALPPAGNFEAAAQVVELAKKWNEEQKAAGNWSLDGFGEGDENEKLYKMFGAYAMGQLNPMAAFFGGVVGQEVIKTSAGKFGPIRQWLYFDAFECMPDELLTDASEFELEGTRYDGQIAVFGKTFQQKVLEQNLFMVGCGALGCEFFKNFAMMGLGAGNGMIYVTDMDTIERSNLNRQFLFREPNIGQLKSEAASEAIKKMNPNINVTTYKIPVGNDTEDTFNDEFWNNLSNVVNALDSVTARRYVDARCVFYKKALLESGTLGTMANVQVVLPGKSESYGSTQDPAGKEIPMCTLKNFPNQIEHCIEWSRDKFQGLFRNDMDATVKYLKEGAEYLETMPKQVKHPVVIRETLEAVKATLESSEGVTFDKCIEWARLRFQEMYYNAPVQLLTVYPPDSVTAEGTPFWSGPKRAPTPVEFDNTDELHMGFIIAAANIRAFNYGIEVPEDIATNPEYFSKVLADVVLPEWQPNSNAKIHTDDKEAAADVGGEEDEEISARLTKELSDPSAWQQLKLQSAHFEKDDDSNFHIDFITACSNLRARNYVLQEADRQATKKIAGRIIPAIATTTAMITGMVMLEQYKLLQGHNELEYYKNGYINLGVPSFQLSETVGAMMTRPKDPEVVQANLDLMDGKEVSEELQKKLKRQENRPDVTYPAEGYNLWDRVDIEGALTVQELMDEIQNRCGFDVDMITYPLPKKTVPLWMRGKKFNDRKAQKVTDVFEEAVGTSLAGKNSLQIDVVCSKDGGDLEAGLPPVVLHW